MSMQWCHEVSKTFSLQFKEMLRNGGILDVSVQAINRENFSDDEMGTVDTIELVCGVDKSTVVVILGDIESDDGPYDGLCWIIVESHPWWRRPWNKLPKRLNTLIVNETGDSTACSS